MQIDCAEFTNLINCRYRAYLKSIGIAGEPTLLDLIEVAASERYRREAIDRMIRAPPAEPIGEPR